MNLLIDSYSVFLSCLHTLSELRGSRITSLVTRLFTVAANAGKFVCEVEGDARVEHNPGSDYVIQRDWRNSFVVYTDVFLGDRVAGDRSFASVLLKPQTLMNACMGSCLIHSCWWACMLTRASTPNI